MVLLITLLLFLVHYSQAYYLPGLSAQGYNENDSVPVLVNAITSSHAVLPYDYYIEKMHYCRPENDRLEAASESLGSMLFGDRLYNSPLKLKMLANETCLKLCDATIPAADAEFAATLVRARYNLNWIVDDLPAATLDIDEQTQEIFYSVGFPVGFVDNNGKIHLNNHFEISIKYHERSDGLYSVVGVLIHPSSFRQSGRQVECSKTNRTGMVISSENDNNITYTYSVNWEMSSTPWATRWDNYLHIFDPKIHWFSLFNSLFIVLLLSGALFAILIRALRRDLLRYNRLDEEENGSEDFGWKLVHGDIFRPPRYGNLFSVLVGSGAHLLSMAVPILVLTLIGFLSPSHRGVLATSIICLYAISSFVCGYVSARIFRMFGADNWKKNVVLTMLLMPGWLFLSFIILNFFLISAQSSGAVPFGTMLELSLVLMASIPSSCFGSFKGLKAKKLEHPVRTNQIPRQIPEQPFYLKTIPSMLLGGLLPFGTIMIELYFIMNSIWSNHFYYMFGFLCLVFLLLAITCSEVAVLMTYFRLCSEDYHWWWRSFLTSGGVAIYVFLFGILYYQSQMTYATFSATVLYFGYTFIMSGLVFLITGSLGAIASFIFVVKMYGSVKID